MTKWDLGLYSLSDPIEVLRDIHRSVEATAVSIEKDNMEYSVKLSVYQLENLRKLKKDGAI